MYTELCQGSNLTPSHRAGINLCSNQFEMCIWDGPGAYSRWGWAACIAFEFGSRHLLKQSNVAYLFWLSPCTCTYFGYACSVELWTGPSGVFPGKNPLTLCFRDHWDSRCPYYISICVTGSPTTYPTSAQNTYRIHRDQPCQYFSFQVNFGR